MLRIEDTDCLWTHRKSVTKSVLASRFPETLSCPVHEAVLPTAPLGNGICARSSAGANWWSSCRLHRGWDDLPQPCVRKQRWISTGINLHVVQSVSLQHVGCITNLFGAKEVGNGGKGGNLGSHLYASMRGSECCYWHAAWGDRCIMIISMCMPSKKSRVPVHVAWQPAPAAMK